MICNVNGGNGFRGSKAEYNHDPKKYEHERWKLGHSSVMVIIRQTRGILLASDSMIQKKLLWRR